jgi:hypothetical protein
MFCRTARVVLRSGVLGAGWVLQLVGSGVNRLRFNFLIHQLRQRTVNRSLVGLSGSICFVHASAVLTKYAVFTVASAPNCRLGFSGSLESPNADDPSTLRRTRLVSIHGRAARTIPGHSLDVEQPVIDPAGASGSSLKRNSQAFALYLVLTIALAYPLTLNPHNSVLAVAPDTDLFMWTLAWDTHAFIRQPFSIFDANIYYPERLTLAYSENLIGSALFAAPVLWLSGNPVLALNMVALLSCALCGLGAYVLGRRVGLQTSAALLCGLIFAFSPPRFFRITQLHLTTVQWVPFGLAFLHAYLDGGRKRDLRFAAGFFTLQALTSGHGAVFLLVATSCVLGYRLLMGEPLQMRKRFRDLGVPGALLLLPTVLVIAPYQIVQWEMGLRRGLENWAATPESFWASPARLQMWLLSFFPDARIHENASAFLFPGYLPLLLAAAAIIRLPRRRTRITVAPRESGNIWARLAILLNLLAIASLSMAIVVMVTGPFRLRLGETLLFSARDSFRALTVFVLCVLLRIALAHRAPFSMPTRARRFYQAYLGWRVSRRLNPTILYALLTLVSLGLAVGPPLSLWPLVYWMPGMNFIRGPSRFILLAVLGLAVLAGLGFERLRARVAPERRVAFAAFAGILLIAEFSGVPLSTIPYSVEIPGVDRWLGAQRKPFAVVELPVIHSEALHTTYMLHTRAHWQKTINGYSGMRPPLHAALFPRLRGFPDEFTLQSLVDLGVDYVVIHTELYPPGEWMEVDARLKGFTKWLKLEYAEGPGLVYSLHGAESEERPPTTTDIKRY